MFLCIVHAGDQASTTVMSFHRAELWRKHICISPHLLLLESSRLGHPTTRIPSTHINYVTQSYTCDKTDTHSYMHIRMHSVVEYIIKNYWIRLLFFLCFCPLCFSCLVPLLSLCFSNRNLPKSPQHSSDHPLQYASKVPWTSRWIDYESTQVCIHTCIYIYIYIYIYIHVYIHAHISDH